MQMQKCNEPVRGEIRHLSEVARRHTLSEIEVNAVKFNMEKSMSKTKAFVPNETLVDILTYRRQHNSEGEDAFIEKYIMPLRPVMLRSAQGDIMAFVLENPGRSTLMWSCHVDTVHWDKPEVIKQEVYVDHEGTAFVDSTANCLGADDGAGVWLMLEMYRAGVKGVYVFHRGEERGCIGSGWIAQHMPDWLATFTHAIAFDRRGTTSIITHQRSGRACSDALGNKLIELFDMNHELDPTGIYTDTAEYMEIIPECVNVSIGYQSEHSHNETCDLVYVQELLEKICAVDWAAEHLPVDRDPYKPEPVVFDGWGEWRAKRSKAGLDPTDSVSYAELEFASVDEIEQYVYEADPRDVAYTIEALLEKIMLMKEGEYDESGV